MAIDQITTGIIKDDAVTAAKIPAGAVVADVGTGGIATANLADDAVTAAKIADNAVGAAAIADDAIGTAQLAGDVAISTSGNIATSGTGTLTVAGASNFASIATGTLASAVVFPSGHVLQTKYLYGPNQASVTSTSTSWVAIDAQELSFTAIQTNGLWRISFYSGRIDANGSDNTICFNAYKSENGGAYAHISNPPSSHSGNYGLGLFDAGAYEGYGGYHDAMYVATIAAGQTIKFKTYTRKNSGTGSTNYVVNGCVWSMMAQEIKL